MNDPNSKVAQQADRKLQSFDFENMSIVYSNVGNIIDKMISRSLALTLSCILSSYQKRTDKTNYHNRNNQRTKQIKK